ncbi:MAG: cytochrome c biogenesis protein CcsA, partial [Candidatus Hermodarchaeota archaeon]
NMLLILPLIVLLIDILYLLIRKENNILLPSLTASLSISAFLVMEFSFLSNLYDFVYVWSYSELSLPIIYKVVAIWAGEAGSIMTWMVFNSIVIVLYRIKGKSKGDIIFNWSTLLALIVSVIFYAILISLNPFLVETPILFPDGLGLNSVLLSPFMIWHPFFTFIAYAVFLIPFTITLVEIIKPKLTLQNDYQKSFYNFVLKFGWLVLSLSIGLGAYWAKITFTWGRYWGWDPVEIVSLIPWFFTTTFFHGTMFKSKKALLIKINVVMIFLSIIFTTLITRGGGLTSLHAFTGESELVIWVMIVGIILAILALYVIYIVINYLLEEYQKHKLFFDYLSYLFLYGLAFVFIFGLIIPPLTIFLSNFLPIIAFSIGPEYFIVTSLILSTGLAITLTFCSLWEYFTLKWIGTVIIIAFLIQILFSYILFSFIRIWINPFLIIYFISLISSIFKLVKTFNPKKGTKYFFRLNSKTIIHAGISLIFAGFLMIAIYQDIFFISGFILLLIGIIPSILISFLSRKNVLQA